jgi:hypothetical protein
VAGGIIKRMGNNCQGEDEQVDITVWVFDTLSQETDKNETNSGI